MAYHSLLVVVFQVHVYSLAVGESEGNSPIAANTNTPNAATAAVKLVEIIAWQVNVSRSCGIL